jgi:predicted nucleotidyltransferase
MEFSESKVATILGLEEIDPETDVAYLSGSVIEGFGNPWSDLDAYVITEKDPVGKIVAEEGGCLVSLHYLEGLRIDFEFWRPARILKLSRKLKSFEIGKGPIVRILTETEELFVHRLLRYSAVIAGQTEKWKQLFSQSELGFYQTQMAVRRLDGLHEDLCGMMEGHDYSSAVFVGRELVSASMDVYLHMHGNTNPTRTGQAQLITRYIKFDDPFVERFYILQFPNFENLSSSPAQMISYLKSCISFQAAIVRLVHNNGN